MELTLNEKSRQSLEKKFGISVSEMSRIDIEDLDKIVEKKSKKNSPIKPNSKT